MPSSPPPTRGSACPNTPASTSRARELARSPVAPPPSAPSATSATPRDERASASAAARPAPTPAAPMPPTSAPTKASTMGREAAACESGAVISRSEPSRPAIRPARAPATRSRRPARGHLARRAPQAQRGQVQRRCRASPAGRGAAPLPRRARPSARRAAARARARGRAGGRGGAAPPPCPARAASRPRRGVLHRRRPRSPLRQQSLQRRLEGVGGRPPRRPARAAVEAGRRPRPVPRRHRAYTNR